MAGLLPTPRELTPARFENIEERLRRLERGGNYGFVWGTYTPTLKATGGGSASIGNGSIGGVYGLGGSTVILHIEMQWGSTTSITGSSWGFQLPADGAPSYLQAGPGNYGATGHCYLEDASTPANNCGGMCYLSTAGTADDFVFMRPDGATAVTPTVPFTFATNDLVTLAIVYPR